ncbi:1-acyl-sn-glycerol-3-phosphate acyltransferase [Frankia sp. CNm7]|uniref:1-acyl-sn-glycerol-3-phosphate acyltransferase n=1 Tax=Frankia nepalensis TaxID=1836974 RepID=A0A937RDE1_9ACTN|nr:1-acyl-sn-glycerol-3-phosphate acyltransferase [Frankia nepalensis]MBL7495612.1 1-acyl-sn-glycerol-3-phosphate acyltransferase [Frankia nepalensis]MBL7508858.1 1-acyl-sn-glycerol-3-phosphate acyltransferase [Frankia nepalensis]MBL7520306.1 1-acyl-sn-glycerol-3-phosphate acyltransferase [Frankia nepalensis]MBL7630081.1 1-acyl-sn-glycerol-3-phosphate acyltransferase [Frankia nepalensis]
MKVPPRAVRRLVVDPLFVPVAVAVVALGVAVTLVGLASAPVDRRLRLSRVATLAATYLLAEVAVIVTGFGLWLIRPLMRSRWEQAHLALLRATLGLLRTAAGRLLRFRLTVQEPPTGPFEHGARPVLVASRHAGAGDSFALVDLVLNHYRRAPRVVGLASLQLDPGIDILLGRLGACFLRTNGADATAVARVNALASRLTGRDALVIFPEGANFTARRRRRLIVSLRRRGHSARAEVAEDLTHVLPPRPAGLLAALDAGTVAGTVVVAHTGLDHLVTPGLVWRALPLAAPMKVRWWWFPADELPATGTERADWLTMQWAVVDAWIDARHPTGPLSPQD